MAEKKVIIFVKSHQHYEGAEPEDMELISEGLMDTAEDGTVTLTYEETELTGLEGTTTQLHIAGPRVTLLRQGSVNSQMIFEVGRKHLSMYETPYGSLAVGVDTRRLKNTVGEGGGELEIDYAIEIDNLLAGKSLFRLNVKSAGSKLKQ